MHGLTCLLSLLPTNPTSPHFSRPTYFYRPATCLPACLLPDCLPVRLPPAGPPALQIAEHVLGQHRYRAPGDDGKNAGDDRYIDK